MDQRLYQDIYTIGPALQRLRRKANLSQEQVAAQLQIRNCKVSRGMYAQMETDGYGIKLSVLAALKEIFKTTYGEFFIDLP